MMRQEKSLPNWSYFEQNGPDLKFMDMGQDHWGTMYWPPDAPLEKSAYLAVLQKAEDGKLYPRVVPQRGEVVHGVPFVHLKEAQQWCHDAVFRLFAQKEVVIG